MAEKKRKKMIVFDTNVLLTEPTVLFDYPGAEVVIPETVLSELDKLKTARVDPDLRFRGREVSRLIFDAAADGNLVEGVDLEGGGHLRVVPFEYNDTRLPDGFTTKTSDDKILATAWVLSTKYATKRDVVLVTNDLNMLLKAQTYGVKVERYGKGDDVSFSKRYIVRPFQRYRVPITILAVALGVFVAVLLIAWSAGMFSAERNDPALSSEFRNLLTTSQKEAYDALLSLRDNPADEAALNLLGEYYYDQAEAAQANGNPSEAVVSAKTGITYFERYLGYKPNDDEARNDMATLYYYSGDTDRAIQEISRVLESSPDDVMANYNLAIFYLFGRQDYDTAKKQLTKVKELTKDNAAHSDVYHQAEQFLKQLEAQQSGDNSQTATDTV
ncbi:MAG: tetratricopeptide repeat protein [Actinomycetes bacterium]|jgi:PhoH-like ATPase|nr:tetratricopeptide repeat protein [Actinomycetes bacterium]